MAESAPKKRRITPQLVPASDSLLEAAPTSQLHQPAFGDISLREQSRLSQEYFGPGRRIYISLHGEQYHVNLKKVLKAQATKTGPSAEAVGRGRLSPTSTSPSKQPSSLPVAPQPANFMTGIIGRMEQRYLHGQAGTNADEEIGEDSEPSSDSTEGDKGSYYGYDDDFIDDEEEAERIEQEHKRPKQRGFFIDHAGDAGANAEAQEVVPPGEYQAKRKTKPKAQKAQKPAAAQDDAGPYRQAASQPDAEVLATTAGSPPRVPVSAAAPPAQAFTGSGIAAMAAAAGWKAATSPPPHEPPREATPTPADKPSSDHEPAPPAQLPGIVTAAPSSTPAKQIAAPETPSKRRVAASPARPFPSELKASLDKLRLHVQSLPPMAAGEKRQLPRSVNPQLDTMSCIIHRHSLPVGSYIVDPLMKFLSVYTNSKNLNNRLRTGRDTVKKGLDGAGAALQQAITFKLPQPGALSHRQNFAWDSGIDKLVTDYARRWVKLNGGATSGAQSEQLYAHMASLWPAGMVTPQQVRQAFKRGPAPGTSSGMPGAIAAPAPAEAVPPSAAVPSQPQSAPPASAPAAEQQPASSSLPVPAADTAPSPSGAKSSAYAIPLWPLRQGVSVPINGPPALPAHFPSRPDNAPGVAMQSQSQPQQQPGAARRTMTLDEIKDVALSKGADKEIVEDSIRFLNSGKSSMKAVLNQVLLLAEGKGLKVAQILDRANRTGLCGSTPWEDKASKKSGISNTLRTDSTFFATVAKATFAHTAFPGVQEAAARHQAQQQATTDVKTAPPQPLPHAVPSKAAAEAGPGAAAAPHLPDAAGMSMALAIGQSLIAQPAGADGSQAAAKV